MSKIFEALQRVQAGGTGAFACPPPPQTDEPAPPVETPGIRTIPLRVPLSAPLFPFDEAHSYAGEQYKIIRTKINQHPRKPRFIAVSSANSADGKSITAINIAAALSLKDDTKVLLVDGDFRRPTIHRQLGLPEGPGLLDFLAGLAGIDDAMVRAEQFPNLYILQAGKPRSNPAELLDSSRWTTLAASLRQRFRYLVVDTPPVLAVADFDLIQATADAIVLVARPDHTKRQALLGALDAIDKDKFLGFVLNYVPDWFIGGSRSYYSDYDYRGKAPQRT